MTKPSLIFTTILGFIILLSGLLTYGLGIHEIAWGIGTMEAAPGAIVGGRVYEMTPHVLNEMTFDDHIINQFSFPGSSVTTRLHCNNDRILFTTEWVNGKYYVYTFDGESFEEYVCLSDYRLFARSNFTALAVSEKSVYLYDDSTGTIKEFKTQ